LERLDEDDFLYSFRKHETHRARKLKGDSKKSDKDKKSGKKDPRCDVGTVLVANRADGTLSVLDGTYDGEVLATIEIPYNDEVMLPPIPQDVVVANGFIYVGDSQNDRVVVLDAWTYEVAAPSIPTGAGLREMAVDRRAQRLWVTNRIDGTVSIIDLAANQLFQTIEKPSTVFDDATILDVVLTTAGDAGFVTYQEDDTNLGGSVYKFSEDGTELAVSGDVGTFPRATLGYRFNKLYVPDPDSGFVDILFQEDLDTDVSLDIIGAFDVAPSTTEKYMYVSSIEGDGDENGVVYTLNVTSNDLLNAVPVEAGAPDPQKLVHTGDLLIVTHVDQNVVSVFNATDDNPEPVLLGTVEVGENPFGIAWNPPIGYSDYC